MASDRYIDFANSDIGRKLVGAVGLPAPARLERWQAGRLRPVEGALLLSGGPLAERVSSFAPRMTDVLLSFGGAVTGAHPWSAEQGSKVKAVVFDASELRHASQLSQLREFFQPILRKLESSAHIVILARAPDTQSDPLAASTQQAIEGFSRSLAKEMRNGSTVQLLQVEDGAEDQLERRRLDARIEDRAVAADIVDPLAVRDDEVVHRRVELHAEAAADAVDEQSARMGASGVVVGEVGRHRVDLHERRFRFRDQRRIDRLGGLGGHAAKVCRDLKFPGKYIPYFKVFIVLMGIGKCHLHAWIEF